MANRSFCTITGKYYTEATIKANLSRAYKEHYLFEPSGACEGCNGKELLTGLSKSEMLETVQEMYKLQYADNWFEFFDRNASLLFIQRNNAINYFDLL